MRRKLLAASLALMAMTALAPVAGADEAIDLKDDGPYVCVRSRLLLGDDSICVKYYPTA